MSEPAYELRGVRKVYNGRLILDVDKLEVRSEEVLAIVGPNGVGKSTLLRLLAFLEAPSRGEISFQGNPSPYPVAVEIRRRIAMVFQRPLMLKRSVRENIAYGLGLRGGKDQSAVESQLERMKLRDLADEQADQLSGGEAQRVALARALVLKPDVLLLDEPTANLDPYNVGVIEDIVKSLRGAGPATIVLVTHNVFQARRLADRMVMLLGGAVIEDLETERFFDAASDPRVAGFIRGDLVS